MEDGKTENDAYLCATLCLFSGMVFLRLLAFLVHKIDPNHHCAADGDCVDEARDVSVNIPPLVSNAEDGAGASAADAAEQGEAAPGQGQETEQAQAPAEGKDAKTKTAAGGAASKEDQDGKQLKLMGLNTAAAIAIHNFPEGLATFVATLAEPSVGVTLAIAIGIHNIPEGLCVALPIYYATDSRLKGFLWALLSGLSEPVGAFIGWLIIKSTGEDMNQLVYGVLFGLVAGMMIMIVILELLPTANKYDPSDKYVTNSFVLGMAVMAASLCMFMA
jgi:ZIP family zinc transporter